MKASRWLNHFFNNLVDRPEPNWAAPITMDPVMIAKVLPSLQQFQLGDGGGPACLIARDVSRLFQANEDMETLVRLWFAEEKEHSRLLGHAVRRFGGKPISGHWSFSAFCACRRILGFRFELQVLLLTEIVSTAYYRVLRRYIADEPIKNMCTLILRDEAGHVAFHRDRLAPKQSLGPLFALLWQAQFWCCGLAAATMLWVNHGPALQSIGGSRKEYYREVRFGLSRFLRRLFYRSAPLPQPPLMHCPRPVPSS